MSDCIDDLTEELAKKLLELGKPGEKIQIRHCDDAEVMCRVKLVDAGKVSDALGELGFSVERNCDGTECVLRGEIAVDRDKEELAVKMISKHCQIIDIHRHTQRRGRVSHIHILCKDNKKTKLETLIADI